MNRGAARKRAEELYRALAAWDLVTLKAILHPDFRGHATAGLPLGLGGDYEGPERMIRDFWARIGRHFDAKAVPLHFAMADDDRLLVQGHYIGRARQAPPGDGQLHAEFHHLLAFEDEKIVSLAQLTDSQKWHEALRPRASAEQELP